MNSQKNTNGKYDFYDKALARARENPNKLVKMYAGNYVVFICKQDKQEELHIVKIEGRKGFCGWWGVWDSDNNELMIHRTLKQIKQALGL